MVALHLPVTAEEIRPRRRTADRRRDLIASDFLCLGVAATSRRARKTLGTGEEPFVCTWYVKNWKNITAFLRQIRTNGQLGM